MSSSSQPRRSQRAPKSSLKKQEIDDTEAFIAQLGGDGSAAPVARPTARANTVANGAKISKKKATATTAGSGANKGIGSAPKKVTFAATGAGVKKSRRLPSKKGASSISFPNLPGAVDLSGSGESSSSVSAASLDSSLLSSYDSIDFDDTTAMATTTAPKTRGRPKKPTAAATTNGKSKDDTTTKAAIAPAARGRKRKTDEDEDVDNEAPPPATKKARATKISKKAQEKIVINHAPTQRLDVYVCGEGSNAELGLGTAKNVIDVKRPRLNANLTAKDVGVVQLSCGGMHTLAVTHDGKVLSWGVNDGGALGRPTGKGPLEDLNDAENDSDDDEDSGLNPDEAYPAAVTFPEGVVIVKVAAGDGISLALTDDGLVYGWGEFRGMQGEYGFWRDMDAGHTTTDEPIFDKNDKQTGVKTKYNLKGVIMRQHTPRLYTELSNIVDIACGNNHCLARTQNGMVFTWGIGENNQLGRRQIERIDTDLKRSLIPQPLRTGKTKFTAIFCGADHSFGLDGKHQVHAWGFNGYGQLAVKGTKYFPEEKGWKEVPKEVVGPIVITSLTDTKNPIVQLAGGQKHSLALRQDGQLLSWGLIEFTGVSASAIPATSLLYNQEPGRGDIASAVIEPIVVPKLGSVVYAGCGSEHTIAINSAGKAYSWGSGGVFQLGLGADEDEPVPTMIDNTAVRDKKLNWASGGGQFSMLTAPAVLENGV